MRTFLVMALACLPLVLPGQVRGAEGPADRGLSVADAVRLALERSPDLAAAGARVEQARAGLARARAAFAPWLGFDFGWLRGDAPSAYLFKRIDGRQLPAALDFNDPPVFDNVEAGLAVRYNLWDGGRKQAQRAQAADLIEAGAEGRAAAANELIWAVIEGYFNLLAAGELARAAELSVGTVDSQLQETEKRFKGGAALKTDVLTMQVRRAAASERLIAARNGEELARAALRRLLDLPPEAPVALSGEEWRPAELPADLASCLEAARGSRPDLAALDHMVAAAREGASLAQRQHRPRLDAMGRYWMDDEGLDLRESRANWTVGAVLSVDLADGGARAAGAREAAAGVAELESRRRSLVRGIELQVTQARLSMDEARARLEVAEANVARAEETLTLVKRQYEGGSATVTRYLEAETDRTEARVREIAARYDAKKAAASLGHVLGLCHRCAAGWLAR